jgi:hypothetical protein
MEHPICFSRKKPNIYRIWAQNGAWSELFTRATYLVFPGHRPVEQAKFAHILQGERCDADWLGEKLRQRRTSYNHLKCHRCSFPGLLPLYGVFPPISSELTSLTNWQGSCHAFCNCLVNGKSTLERRRSRNGSPTTSVRSDGVPTRVSQSASPKGRINPRTTALMCRS